MKKILGILFGGGGTLFVILAIICFLKNPSEKDFEAFIKKKDEETRKTTLKEEGAVGLITSLFKDIPKNAAAKVERENYYVCSTYTRSYSILGIDHTQSDLPEPETYLGVLGKFIKID
jgi:hypothetical protein